MQRVAEHSVVLLDPHAVDANAYEVGLALQPAALFKGEQLSIQVECFLPTVWGRRLRYQRAFNSVQRPQGALYSSFPTLWGIVSIPAPTLWEWLNGANRCVPKLWWLNATLWWLNGSSLNRDLSHVRRRITAGPRRFPDRMEPNAAPSLLDTTIGAIPLVGDAFDLMFRANMKNMALLRRHMEKLGFTRTGGPTIEGEAVRVREGREPGSA